MYYSVDNKVQIGNQGKCLIKFWKIPSSSRSNMIGDIKDSLDYLSKTRKEPNEEEARLGWAVPYYNKNKQIWSRAFGDLLGSLQNKMKFSCPTLTLLAQR